MTQETTGKMTRTEVREKFTSDQYSIHFVGRHIEISEAMKNYALEKLTKGIEKFGARIIDVLIIMDLQRGISMVDFLVNINNKKILVSGREKEMYESIDAAIKHLKSKLSRYHDELHNYDRQKIERALHPGPTAIDTLDDINDQIEEETIKNIEKDLSPHPITKREKHSLKLLNEQEAVWRMENSSDVCLLFLGEEDEKIKVIYRQRDGTYGIMEPE